ncbi:hypothetical protein [Klebsiella phage 05F01]|nr:hypothetical protein [Klebsiella phage 05F01]
MKLKDLLVKYSDDVDHLLDKIKNIWDSDVEFITQDNSGEVCFWRNVNLYHESKDKGWFSEEGDSLVIYEFLFNGEVADDYETAVIKKEDYLNMVNKKDIYKLAFYTNTITKDQLQKLYDILHDNGVDTYFESAEAHASSSNIFSKDDHTIFLCGDVGIEGGRHNANLREIVSYEEFYSLLKEKHPLVKEKSPSPRFHKKRIPVPVRKKVDVVVKYKDGSRYCFKDVVYWNATENSFYVKERKVVSEGIESSIGTYIDKKYIQSVNIKEIGGSVNIVSVTDFWYYGDSSKFFGEGLFSKSY